MLVLVSTEVLSRIQCLWPAHTCTHAKAHKLSILWRRVRTWEEPRWVGVERRSSREESCEVMSLGNIVCSFLSPQKKSFLPLLRIWGSCAFKRKDWTHRPFQAITSEQKQAALQKQQSLPLHWPHASPHEDSACLLYITHTNSLPCYLFCIWMLTIPTAPYLPSN